MRWRKAGRKSALLSVQQGEPGHKGLAATVTAAKKLDGSFAGLSQVELAMQFVALLLDAHRKLVHAALGHEAFAQGLENMGDVFLTWRAHLVPSRT